jgi:membrane protease YdiL (CAAX protease family)
MSGWSQFFFFCFLAFSGYILALLLLLVTVDIHAISESIHTMRIAMFIQSVCIFFIPSIAFIYLCQENPNSYLGIGKKQRNDIQLLVLCVILIVVIQPLITSISYYNQQLVLPESMASLQNWMRESEESAKKSFSLLFADKSISGFFLNLFILAVVAGIVEEFFFRGCLQQIVQRIVINQHLTIWITAIIFSAIHFQFYGFVSRLLLGALLGYIFVWSRNIWIPVLVHIAHNAINVLFAFLYFGTEKYEQYENFSISERWSIILPSLLISVSLLTLIYRKRHKIEIL